MYRKKRQLLPISRFAYGHNDHGAQSKEVQPGNFTYLYKNIRGYEYGDLSHQNIHSKIYFNLSEEVITITYKNNK